MEGWQARTSCPPPELLLPAQEGSLLPENLAAAVRAHVAGCPLCAELTAALDDAAMAPSEAEARRIEQRVRFQTRGRSRLWWTSLAAAAALVAVAGAAYIARMSQRSSAPVVQQQQPRPPAGRLPVLALSAPAILLPPESLTLRGDRRSAYAAALEDALTVFAAGRYQDAAARLERVSRDHPRRPHAEFYLGAARLMNGSAADAVEPLQQARGLAPAASALQTEATWYLAVALERSGRGAAAVDALNDLCARSGPRKAQACEGLRDLSTR